MPCVLSTRRPAPCIQPAAPCIQAPRPVIVSAAEEGGRTFKLKGHPGTPLQVSCLACGYYHTAACTIEGELFCWGKNSDGQLGLGDLHDRGFPHLLRGFGGELLLQVACDAPP